MISASAKGWKIACVLVLASCAFGCARNKSSLDRGVEVMKQESKPEALSARGDGFASLGDMTRAEQYYVAAMRAGGEPGSLVRKLVAVCVADGRYPVALAYSEDYLRNHPHDVDVHFVAATLHAALSDMDGARDGYRRVLSVAPNHADAHYALAQLEREGGNVMAADTEYREYLRIEPNGRHAEVARSHLMQTVPR